MIFKKIALAVLALHAFSAGLANADECKEQTLVKFLAGGVEQASKVIGLSPECDGFGGNLVYTPKHKIFVYVNFNNSGTINLDKVDAALDAIPADNQYFEMLGKIQIAVVDKDWIKKTHFVDNEAILNMAGDTFFVSGKVLEEGRFEAVVADLYNTALGK